MHIETQNIECLQISSNDMRTVDYQERVALPAVVKLKTRFEEALATEGVGEIATEILTRYLETVNGVIDEYRARRVAQKELFPA
ncbi:hypothetical protein [Pseudomonas brenneri]